jgi:hypothetical protein
MHYPCIVRAANVNDKILVKPLLRGASKLLRLHGKHISHFIAESQYYSEEVFKEIRRYGVEPLTPHTSKEPLINLYVTKRFRVKGGGRIVELYKCRMAFERTFKASKLELSMEKPKWRQNKNACFHMLRMHSRSSNISQQIGRPEPATT